MSSKAHAPCAVTYPMRLRLTIFILGLAAALSFARADEPVSFRRDVASLLQRRCGN